MSITVRFRSACKTYWESRDALGERAFNRFAADASEDFTRLTASIVKKWRLPDHAAGTEDVRQEMLVGALAALRKFDPLLGPIEGIAEYVLKGAMTHAKRELHRMRGACLHGNVGKNPSSIDLPFSSLQNCQGDHADADVVDIAADVAGMNTKPNQEDRVFCRQLGRGIEKKVRNVVEREVLISLFEGGDLDSAVFRVYDDAEVCATHRIGSEEDARSFVNLAARSIRIKAEQMVA